MSAQDVTEVSFAYLVTSRALTHMLILLWSLCCLLEEIIATCYMKLSGATVKSVFLKVQSDVQPVLPKTVFLANCILCMLCISL